MCAPSPSGGALVGVLSSPVAVVGVAVVGSGGVLAAMAGGSTVLAWVVIALTAYSALTTIALLVRRANQPTVRVTSAAPPVRQRATAVILQARHAEPPAIEATRPALESAAPARRRVRWS